MKKYLTLLCALITGKRVLVFILGLCVGVALALGYVALTTKGNPIPDKLLREAANTEKNVVNDVTELNPVVTQGIIVPHTREEIIEAVRTHDHVSIGGGRNSMGGQTASERAVQIDMREYNKVLAFDASQKEITVEAGARWRDIQDYIDPHNLSVSIMQTYSNFTVGGSLSVNVHGRYIGLGPVIMSVKSFRIVLADGTLVEASPLTNNDIFYSAIGGMGGVGVITDVTLSLADNVNVERSRTRLKTEEYADFFRNSVRDNKEVIFHNGDMYPPEFENVSAVSWIKTDKEPTTAERLIPRQSDYWKERAAWLVMSEWPFGRRIREYLIDPWLYSETVVHTRNYEASYDVAELEPKDRDGSTYVLQEYFVPVERFDEWVPLMKKVFNDYDVNVINVSIRHALPDPGAKLAWARSEVFAFVVYYKQGTDEESKNAVGVWTRKMIDAVLQVGGTYYLPYQLLATDEQFHRAYPAAFEYFELKRQYDPRDKFTNKLWDRYYSEEKYGAWKEERERITLQSGVTGYYRPIDNTYLGIPEWYIVYSADEYANILRDGLPSAFPYRTAYRDYWKQHQIVTALAEETGNDNANYLTVLSVIGWSFATENAIKGIYENTIGRVSEWVGGGQIPEDVYASKVARDYAQFIYDYPWYDFDYGGALKGVWVLQNDTDESLREWVRRLERKVFLSLEYSVKAGYSSVIQWATHAKFGVQDDIVSATISRDGGKTYEFVQAPHYQPFTRALLMLLEAEAKNPEFRIYDIAGNESVSLVYLDVPDAPLPEGTELITSDVEVQGIQNNELVTLTRHTILTPVTIIPQVYRELMGRGVAVAHFYDY